MSSPETSPVRKMAELGKDTRVQLGAVCVVFMTLLGGGFWLTNLHEHVSLMDQKLQALQAGQDKDRIDVEKRLDRIESKLDRALERKP